MSKQEKKSVSAKPGVIIKPKPGVIIKPKPGVTIKPKPGVTIKPKQIFNNLVYKFQYKFIFKSQFLF